MASSDTISRVFLLMTANWPNYKYGELTLEMYEKCLADMPDDLLEAACLHCMATKKFFPVIAELRRAAFEIVADAKGLPSAYEAWGMVLRRFHMGMGSVFYRGERRKLKPLHRLIEEAVKNVGGWQFLGDSENPVADRARFIEAYNEGLNREAKSAQTLSLVGQFVEKLKLGGNGQEKELPD